MGRLNDKEVVPDRKWKRGRSLLIAVLMTAMSLGLTTLSPTAAAAPPQIPAAYDQIYRPQIHYSPAENWINDPNGMVYYKGEYHLFYQYNPEGSQWGNMSWGHAVSRDLVHWEELPLAIPYDENELIFSGSAVVDYGNTSGFGTMGNPAMVAIYTSAVPGDQYQSLAYSTDRGRTWTKYAGNPVLDHPDPEFRDPKVFWYEEGGYWIMSVVLAVQRKVAFYRSDNLKDWSLLSEFGPAGAVGGVWECPDLFPLPVDGNNQHQKWVLVVSLNPGGIAGGSGTQYFVGDFDGTTFTPDDDGSYTPPTGTVVEDFESLDFGDWTITGSAFGSGPAPGNAPGQGGVTGYQGERLANSFHGGDASTGTLTSPTFTATTPYLNFLVGGGNHPHDPNAVLNPTPPTGTLVPGGDFEGGTYDGWVATGNAFGAAPATGTIGDQQQVSGFLGQGLVNTFLDHDLSTGTLTSPDFTITGDYINFLIGGGRHPMSAADPTAINLLVDGQVVRTATGSDNEFLNWASWDVRDLAGQTAQIQIVDQNTGGWGHINVDHILQSDTAAQPRSNETSVNLVVDGEIVQSVTGPNSETLDWASFDLRPYAGQQVQIQIIDMNTGGWGHILADHFVAATEAALSTTQRADWLDYGKDYYAAVSWNNVPGGKRYMIGWMSNWQYAGSVPTEPWRGAMSLVRQVTLETIDGEVRVVQEPVNTVRSLRHGPAYQLQNTRIGQGVTDLPDRADGSVLEIQAEFELGTADEFGLIVRGGDDERTLVGYDVDDEEVFVDRTQSGIVDFSADFPGVHAGPLQVRDNRVTFTVYVDRSSVEVFAGRGETTITDLIFPDPSSDETSLYAEGGTVTVRSLTVRPLRSIWIRGAASHN